MENRAVFHQELQELDATSSVRAYRTNELIVEEHAKTREEIRQMLQATKPGLDKNSTSVAAELRSFPTDTQIRNIRMDIQTKRLPHSQSRKDALELFSNLAFKRGLRILDKRESRIWKIDIDEVYH